MAEAFTIVPCPNCRCSRTSVLDVREVFGMTTERRRCDHCGRAFSHTPTITYRSVRCHCPNCTAENPPVTKTIPTERAIVRYHKCARCAYTFKSQEAR